ncbi:MAG: alpha-E domain-containing protein [Alphaproteobacteria bacterium]
MLSRIAERLYWMARYIERAENTARLVSVNKFLLLDFPRKARLGWEPLIEITDSAALFGRFYKRADETSIVAFLLSDERNPGSVVSALRAARENARVTRDLMPREAWEVISGLHQTAVRFARKDDTRQGRFEFLTTIIRGAQTMSGLLAGTMNHDQGYNFMKMGRNLERADMTTRIVDVRSGDLLPESPSDLSPFQSIQWMSVLRSMSGYQMYRRCMNRPVRRADVLRFLLQSFVFPRAVAHCLREVDGCLLSLPRNDAPFAVLQQLLDRLADTAPDGLSQQALHEFLDELQIAMGALHDAVASVYFAAHDVLPPEERTESQRHAARLAVVQQ